MIVAPYLLIGLGVYLAAAAINRDSFKDASFAGCFRGVLFGLLLWPVGLVVLWNFRPEKRQ